MYLFSVRHYHVVRKSPSWLHIEKAKQFPEDILLLDVLVLCDPYFCRFMHEVLFFIKDCWNAVLAL